MTSQNTYYTREQVKEAIKHRLDMLEAKHRVSYPSSFSEMTYPIRKAKYLKALHRLDSGQSLSNQFLAKLLGKGARLYDDDTQKK